MARQTSNRNLSPLDRAALERLALRYVERYATTQARLGAYLDRKLRERGWAAEGAPPVAQIIGRFAELGYVDDRGFGAMKAESLARRGYGDRRIALVLRAAGIANEDAEAIRAQHVDDAETSALAFARRRRIGPFAKDPPDPASARRALAAMLRAGHMFDVARKILALPSDDFEDDDMRY